MLDLRRLNLAMENVDYGSCCYETSTNSRVQSVRGSKDKHNWCTEWLLSVL